MRKIEQQVVPSLRLKMIIPRVINSIPRETGDVFTLQEPYASMLVTQGFAEQFDGDVEDEPKKGKLKLTAGDPTVTKAKKGDK